ncbi:nucleotidyltransferase family protein [Curtobacterium sp. S6]|uniref:nucleotidyltransferase family protein n=1 Tax=Curtobacterium sp. S6 TaxID=1479623 RepID=UPI0006901774|nr:nucleotidyltransferase family protein [Curtobacterium sp. S6]
MNPRPLADPAVTGCALILAAGQGRRLGAGPKALLPWGGSTLVARAVRAAQEAGLVPVTTVGPARTQVLRQLATAGPAGVRHAVPVPDFEVGMSASWKAGVAAIGRIPGTTPKTPVVVMLVDQPGVGAGVLTRLVRGLRPGRVVRAVWQGQPGHPVAMTHAHAREAAALSCGDEAARTWMRSHAHLVDGVECADLGFGQDIDTPQDWATALELDGDVGRARSGREAC